MILNTHRIPGLVMLDHQFSLPLDYAQPTGTQISVFARELVAPGNVRESLPMLIFFQGGPGFPSPRPLGRDGWIKRALEDYRVLLLDQRGTGLSTPLTYQTLARFSNPQEQAAYLKHFRADNIVRDAERIRAELLGPEVQWSALGQSYGGFCIGTYLSFAAHGLKEAIITGGLPPVTHTADDVYRATYQRVTDKNQLYYARYPDDVQRVQDIVSYLDANDVCLPQGERLTARRFQQLGLAFGASTGFENVHYLLEQAFVDGLAARELGYTFLYEVERASDFQTNPIFAILHEAIYCQGAASNWAAERVRAEYPQFAITPGQPVYFTGEMIYSWMFDDYRYLQPLKAAAELLAADTDWPLLYDVDVLKKNSVPVAATIYYNDMYVERRLAEETARLIKGTRVWVTDEYEHNALRADGERVLDRLLGMLHGEV
ncbi:MAG: alpha/beta fold hydrolase [Anaerolineae bacterium]